MKLIRYKVKNFKSVKDSGWIECSDVTTLVGINEAGKSNLLLALWKLNPVSGGNMDIVKDAPVSDLAIIRDNQSETEFIIAEFELGEEENKEIQEKLGQKISEIDKVIVTRFYDGHYDVDYPENTPLLLPIDTKEDGFQDEDEQEDKDNVIGLDMERLNSIIIETIPKFVYYSNYGNLNSRLYLPNVIDWLNGKNVQGIDRNEDQIRTMRVLFEFVNLNPEEIKDLGLDPKEMAQKRSNRNIPSAEEIEAARKHKEERFFLLNSAATKLTQSFREWWKQGNYKFSFNADGDYFNIWVSDDKRPAEVGLDQRSTGLQWFLSFYLVFLVESKFHHRNAILLLDEAGLTLHPNAQKDLSLFFNELSKDNQIINTTHSPFVVDTNNIDRCKVVYVDKDGFTVASSNLRERDDKLNEQSIYAVHAALGLTVSDILFQGCNPIIVEGPSDQIYLNAIKQTLIANKKISPIEELIFVPAGGVRGVSAIGSILGGKKGFLPIVLVDSDKSGKDFVSKLKKDLYKDYHNLILEIGDFVEISNAEIEDLIPYSLLEKGINKLFRDVEDEEFSDIYERGKPILPQLQEFASKNEIGLPNGWKVELAKSAKSQILKVKEAEILGSWKKLFDKFDKLNTPKSAKK